MLQPSRLRIDRMGPRSRQEGFYSTGHLEGVFRGLEWPSGAVMREGQRCDGTTRETEEGDRYHCAAPSWGIGRDKKGIMV